MHLYLLDSPRTLVLATSDEEENAGFPSRALLFRPSKGSQAIVEFLHKADIDLRSAVRLNDRSISGCLGLINVGEDIFLAVVTSASTVGNVRPSAPEPEVVSKIHDVAFYCLNSSYYDPIVGFHSSYEGEEPRYNANTYPSSAASQTAGFEHPCAPLNKIFSSGTFYYASQPHWDLSTHLEERLRRANRGAAYTVEGMHDLGVFDPRFVWNEFIARSLLDFRERLDPEERYQLDRCQFIILAIQGYVGIFTVALPLPPIMGSPVVGSIALISRLGWKRAGTRFNTRGVDDDGNVANFVETETLFSTNDSTLSYVQVRGSIPLFWEQQGIQTFGHKIQITRPQLASQPAFERHFAQLLQEYGAVHAINLLGSKDNEVVLAQAYSQHLKATELGASDSVDMGITNFDFHGQVRVGGHDSVPRELRRLDSIRNGIEKFGFTTAAFGSNELLTEQRGVFRTNCLDCLDRTNFVQDILSRVILEQFCFNIRREWNNSIHLWNYHRELWAENGDALSKIYAGTGALNTSFTRTGKRTLAGVLSDATKSVSRAYINNFQDKGKQTAIDMFLGNLSTQRQVTIFDPIHDSVRAALEARKAEYSTTKESTIFVGTYNLNGRPPSPESILPWLFPDPNGPEPDMMVLGFQEIVPLTAQQIVQTDPEKMVRWERKIMDTLSKRESKTQYLILRSEQLVGTALIVVVKSELTTVIRNVEAATRKTGLRGMSGNKGAVAIRLNYHDTSFCFLTAHLAAGHVNVDERNSDYRTISENLHFSKNRHIEDHENVIWAGDTNYRIDLDYDTAKSLAAANQLGQLLKYDQLIEAMQTGMAFGGYKERIPNFKPTYRYDLHSDEYDTSEKRRVPAWTDRIIFRGDELKNTVYSRAELRSSDHRPVYAIFKTQVLIIDSEKRNALQQDLLSSLTATEPGQKLDDKLMALTLESPSADDLPPPSSEDFAWWDGPGHPEGVFPPSSTIPSSGSNNPFDSDVTSTCSSDEELYRESSALQPPIQPRKPPPPPPPTRKPVVVVANADKE